MQIPNSGTICICCCGSCEKHVYETLSSNTGFMLPHWRHTPVRALYPCDALHRILPLFHFFPFVFFERQQLKVSASRCRRHPISQITFKTGQLSLQTQKSWEGPVHSALLPPEHVALACNYIYGEVKVGLRHVSKPCAAPQVEEQITLKLRFFGP